MKQNFLLAVVFAFCFSSAVVAQTSYTPEVPRNYKPQARELLPMPAELTDEMIFPVLGQYEYTSEEGELLAQVTIVRDTENKGIVWVNGLPQGRFKADLRVSPATYKIPAQKTLINQSEEELALSDSAETGEATKPALRYSGKSIKEGTLLLDSSSQKLYVNLGTKYNENEPASVFPELAVETNYEEETSTTNSAKTSKKKSEPAGTKYILTKKMEMASAPDNTSNNSW